MTPERWQRLQTLFDVAVELPPEARAGLLADAGREDPSLRAELEAMLAADPESDTGLQALISGSARTVARGGLGPGSQVGNYRVVREIAEGGMGAVYEAEREEGGFEQRVAVKIIGGGLVTNEARRRFLAERQILAGLRHPGIAQLLDGGATEDGTPYLVMEFIEGLPIDEYCDRERLGLRQRLELFTRVCDAVQYAHQKLIVHRDIKPSNILVTADGTPRLLDFGIAKLLGGDEAAPSTRTLGGARMLTPEYASPEQVRGDAVTTASDVYSLGALLYRLLSGAHAHALPGNSQAELERVICHTEPSRPSTRVTEAAAAAAARGTTPARLRRSLSGDLDNIVLMAMRREPERRYGTARQLAEDVRNHLASRPVLARPDAVSYRVGRFVQRHRAGVAMTAAAVVLLTSVVSFYTWQLRQQRDRAQLEAAKATQVAEMMTDVFRNADPGHALEAEVSARTLLDAGATRIDEELAGQPELRAAMLQVMGESYRGLGALSEAEDLLRRSLALRRSPRGGAAAELGASLHSLAWVLREQARYEAAEPLAREALAVRLEALGEEAPATTDSRYQLAVLAEDLGRQDEAYAGYTEVIARRRAQQPPDGPALATSLGALAALVSGRGDFTTAEAHAREAAGLREAAYGDRHPAVAADYNLLGSILRNQGDHAGGLEQFRRVEEIRRSIYGDEHPEVAKALANQSAALYNLKRHQEAIRLAREAEQILARTLGPDHLHRAFVLDMLAHNLLELGDYEAALPTYEMVLAKVRDTFGEEHVEVAMSLSNLGGAYHRAGRHAEGLDARRQALEIYRNALGEDAPLVIRQRVHVADSLRQLGAPALFAESEQGYRDSIAALEAALPGDHLFLGDAKAGLAELLLETGRADEAEAFAREALEHRLAYLAEDDPLVVEINELIAACVAR